MLRVCGGLDLHGDGVEVDVGQSGICRKFDDEHEMESVGDAVVIWTCRGEGTRPSARL